MRRIYPLLTLVAVLLLAPTLGGSTRAPGTPLIFAHHGDTTVAPENTIAAIAAATSWADGVEFDVRLAPDRTWRLSHAPLPTDWQSLPTLTDSVAAAGDLLLDIDLKDSSDDAHRRLAEWIEAAGIANRATVNVKSLSGARLIATIAPGVTIEAQPEWVPEAATAAEIDIVLVWGDRWRDVLLQRPAASVGLFVNSIHEPGLTRWAEAVAEGIGRYLADGDPGALR